MEKRCVPALIFILVLLASSSTEATIYKLFYRCSNPGVPKNGLRRGDHFGVGYSVEYGCHSNFTMIGTKRATCMFMKYSIGWSSEPPSCIIGELLSVPQSAACYLCFHSYSNQQQHVRHTSSAYTQHRAGIVYNNSGCL